MRTRRTDDQLLFEWPDESTPSCAGDGPEDDDVVYPLSGPDRFRQLPLTLPPGFRFYLGTHHAADLAVSPDRRPARTRATSACTARRWCSRMR